MTPVEKAIQLLKCYTINNNREQLVEAHHLIGKYLDNSEVIGVPHTKRTIRVWCVDCGVEFQTKQCNKQRCPECEVMHKHNYYAEKWARR